MDERSLVLFRARREAVWALIVLASLWLIAGLLSISGIGFGQNLPVGAFFVIGGGVLLWFGIFPDDVEVAGGSVVVQLNGRRTVYALANLMDIHVGVQRGRNYPILVFSDGRKVRLRRLRTLDPIDSMGTRVGLLMLELRQRMERSGAAPKPESTGQPSGGAESAVTE